MIVGIDASNIRHGGGVGHLRDLLRAADPTRDGFSRIIIWSGAATLDRLDDRPWLIKAHDPLLDRGLIQRAFWQRVKLSASAREANCAVLFVPGGSFAGDFKPFVAMSQNLLPFEFRELRRFGLSLNTLKFLALRWIQARTFARSEAVIFLTDYARDVVCKMARTQGRTHVIPHGLDDRFRCPPRRQRSINDCCEEQPFRILYVSMIDMYKHQCEVSQAVADLRRAGFPIALEMVGPAYPPALKLLRQTLREVDPGETFISYTGAIPHDELAAKYRGADLFVFASSCETFGQIVTEAMASGLPIACSNASAMPELLGNAGVYFDPEEPASIAAALNDLINSPDLRARNAAKAFRRATEYSWSKCARDTFRVLHDAGEQVI